MGVFYCLIYTYYMIITRLFGGMGNQMFQYALGRVLALKNNTELKLDIRQLTDHGNRPLHPKHVNRNYDLDLFKIHATIAQQSDIPWKYRVWGSTFFKDATYVITRKLFANPYKEKYFHFNPSVLDAPNGSYIEGFWQSYKYFEEYENVIKKDFQVAVDIPELIQKLGEQIQQQTSLCVHVRRGDFVNNSYHSVLQDDYYDQALQKITEKVAIENIYVFSDDIDWCKDNIKFPVETMFVGNEYSGERGIGHFWLMQQCKHFIIPNSTFSWWTAWLADYSNKVVVMPKKWLSNDSINYQDIIPPGWISL
jgi:hypothetical protein